MACSVAYARTSGWGDPGFGRGDLVGFRREFYACLTARADALFELTDAVLCADGPVTLPGRADPDRRAPPRARRHEWLRSHPRLLPCGIDSRRVDLVLTVDCPVPSLQPHYRAFIATTNRSAPVPRIGTLPLTAITACGPPSRDR